jgi:beta-aspartyl-peptidase (threonine type)
MILLTAIFAAAAAAAPAPANAAAPEKAPLTIVIHGGAGALAPGKYTQDEEAAYKAKLKEALDLGYGILAQGGGALDAVEAAVALMEDSPLFNAGRGAVFTFDGRNELDASIMDGRTKAAGAVAGVTRVKNPIRLARAVMEKSEQVMLAGAGAEEFARERGIERVEPSYFRTERRWKEYQDALAAANRKKAEAKSDKYGTVGVVALDGTGNIAAGTSTGGRTLKRYGRVGDSPIIGAGTYADARCGVSGTGWGEYFIRLTVARDICAGVAAGMTVEAAAAGVLARVKDAGGDGGVIVLDAQGRYAMTFNTDGMFRGVRQGDREEVAIYKD